MQRQFYTQIHFFIQTEENNYNKVLGSKRINVQEWNDSKKERIVEIDLEEQNILNIVLKCNVPQKEDNKQIADKSNLFNRQKYQTTESLQWSKSLRDSNSNQLTKKDSQNSGHSSSNLFKSHQGKQSCVETSQTSALEECKQFLHNRKLSESDEIDLDHDHEKQIQTDPPLSSRTFTPLPIQQSPASQIQTRVQTENSEKSRLSKLNESSSLEGIEGQYNNSFQNRLSNLESLMAQKMVPSSAKEQQRFRNSCNEDLYEEQLYQYKHMIKEISLLLDIHPDCNNIVMAVSRLVQKERQQTEQIIKLQCDNQVIQSHLQNMTIQQSLFQDKHLDIQKTIKQKLKIYQTLFEENVQLKTLLKQDLQKIVNLSMELKQYKNESIQQCEVDKQITQLHLDIKNVCSDVDEKRIKNMALHEEISLLQQLVDDSLNHQKLID